MIQLAQTLKDPRIGQGEKAINLDLANIRKNETSAYKSDKLRKNLFNTPRFIQSPLESIRNNRTG